MGNRGFGDLGCSPNSVLTVQNLGYCQVHRKSVKKGFEFTLMVVGESGQLTLNLAF